MGQITIGKPFLEERVLKSTVTVSNDIRKYIKNSDFFIEYNDEIKANESILNIPLTATILPLAWLTGSNVYVGNLDKRFKESMDLLQKTFAETYPLGRFTTEIKADKLTDNKTNPANPENNTGILFSGGVDSTYSLYKNIHLNPKLIMLWGIDDFSYPEKSEYWTKVISIYKNWANKHNLEYHIVKTNNSQILDDRRIEHKYNKIIYDGRLRPALQHSLVLLPTAAPLSIGRFNRFIIAASGTPESHNFMKPRAARPWFDEKIVWADLNVINHGSLSRNKKIQEMKEFILNEGVTFKVCVMSKPIDDYINDSSCEKCYRTIISLVISGIDPNLCGFKVDETTFLKMKNFWLKRKSTRMSNTWTELQELIPEEIEHDFYGSKAFFEWYRDFDLSETERSWLYNDLYNALPYSLAKLLDKVYHRYGINIHENPKKRINKKSLPETKQSLS